MTKISVIYKNATKLNSLFKDELLISFMLSYDQIVHLYIQSTFTLKRNQQLRGNVQIILTLEQKETFA